MSEQPLLSELDKLVSEERNPCTMDIDLLTSLAIVRRINDEDHLVPAAVEKVLPQVAKAVDRIVDAFRSGGRLIYLGPEPVGVLAFSMHLNVRRHSAYRKAWWSG